jgi:hypothetical protein
MSGDADWRVSLLACSVFGFVALCVRFDGVGLIGRTSVPGVIARRGVTGPT